MKNKKKKSIPDTVGPTVPEKASEPLSEDRKAQLGGRIFRPEYGGTIRDVPHRAPKTPEGRDYEARQRQREDNHQHMLNRVSRAARRLQYAADDLMKEVNTAFMVPKTWNDAAWEQYAKQEGLVWDMPNSSERRAFMAGAQSVESPE